MICRQGCLWLWLVCASYAAEETRKKEMMIGWLTEAEGKGAAAARGRPPFLLRARATLPVVCFLPPWKWSQGKKKKKWRRNCGRLDDELGATWSGGQACGEDNACGGCFFGGDFFFSPYVNFFVYKMFADGKKDWLPPKDCCYLNVRSET
jgi:hypothetical protein